MGKDFWAIAFEKENLQTLAIMLVVAAFSIAGMYFYLMHIAHS